MPW
jgi:hypothetical protein